MGVAREGLRAAAAAGACPPCRRSRSRVGACPRMVAVRHGRRRRHHTGSSLHPFGLPRGGQHRWWSLVVAVRRRAPCEDPRRRAWGTPSPGGLGPGGAPPKIPDLAGCMSQHGDIFPLPKVWRIEDKPCTRLSRRTRQRVCRRIAHARAATECVSLNSAFGVTSEQTSAAFFCSIKTKCCAVFGFVRDL